MVDDAERLWLAGADPVWMLAVLTDGTEAHRRRLGVSRRRLLLFAAAAVCSHPDWPRVRLPAAHQAVAALEAHAECGGGPPPAAYTPPPSARRRQPHILVAAATHHDPVSAAAGVVRASLGGDRRYAAAARARLGGLLHEFFGNPFDRQPLLPGPAAACPLCAAPRRRPTAAGWCPACRGAGTVPTPCPFVTPQVLAVAQAAYAGCDWDALPILADALEDAGYPTVVVASDACAACAGRGCFQASGSYAECPNCLGGGGTGTGRVRRPVTSPLLAHLRGGGPHRRGCWALDTVLGRV